MTEKKTEEVLNQESQTKHCDDDDDDDAIEIQDPKPSPLKKSKTPKEVTDGIIMQKYQKRANEFIESARRRIREDPIKDSELSVILCYLHYLISLDYLAKIPKSKERNKLAN